jgi:AhpD family alkylhydroperoxidase
VQRERPCVNLSAQAFSPEGELVMGTEGKVRAATAKDVYREITDRFGLVPEWYRQFPEAAVVGFWDMQRDFELAETKIPIKYKELIGIAVSGATRCRYCALFHTEVARIFGATDDEVAEASTMAGFTMMASTFLNAQQVDYLQFKKETLEMVDHVKALRATKPAQPPTDQAQVARS